MQWKSIMGLPCQDFSLKRETHVDEMGVGLRGGMRVMLRLRSSSHSRLGSCSVITCRQHGVAYKLKTFLNNLKETNLEKTTKVIENLLDTVDNEPATKVDGKGSNETDGCSKH